MDERVAELVQNSWRQVVPIADQAAVLFYDRLFELDPRLRQLFPEDLTEQRKKLMATLGAAVMGLSNAAAVVTTLRRLGARHQGYGVADEDYDTVGQALLWTLSQGLGEAFTEDVESAWTAVYTLVATTMKEAAAEAAAA